MFLFIQFDEATEHLRSCIRLRKRGAGQIGVSYGPFSFSSFFTAVLLLNPTFLALLIACSELGGLKGDYDENVTAHAARDFRVTSR